MDKGREKEESLFSAVTLSTSQIEDLQPTHSMYNSVNYDNHKHNYMLYDKDFVG